MIPSQSCSRATRAIAAAVLLGGLLLPASLGTANRAAAAASVDSGTLTLTFGSDVADIDPANNELEFADTVERNIDETLIRLAGSSAGSFEPDLATSWSSNANQSIWTFKLRHGVRFHSGRCCMTADDVKYSIGRSVAAQLAGSYMMGRFLTAKDPFSQIKVIDPYTIQFKLDRSYPIFPAAIAQDYNSLILDSVAVKKHATKSDPYAHDFVSQNDVGTGPYAIQSWQHGSQITLAKFAPYWAGWNGNHFSKIIITTVPDASTRRQLIERGQATMTMDLTPQDVTALRANHAVRVTSPYATEVQYVAMTQYGPLASPLARQALSYAVPYDAIIHGLYRDYARRAYGPIPAAVFGYDAKTFHYQTDMAKAKALLQQAGVAQGTTLTYAYDSGIDIERNIGLLLQASFSQLGLSLKIQGLSSDSFQTIIYGTDPSKKPNLMAYSWWPDYNDPYDMADTLVDSKQAPPNGSNIGNYHDAKADAALAQMDSADQALVLRASKTLQDITGRLDPPCLWISEPQQTVVMNAKLQGYIANPVELRTYYFYTMHF
jgi:peptide/nickel transport system substrate-binding protein